MIRFRNLKRILEDYKIHKFNNITAIDSEFKEEEFEKLEKELFEDLVTSIDLSLIAGSKINKSTVLDILYRYGAIGAARRLVIQGAEEFNQV